MKSVVHEDASMYFLNKSDLYCVSRYARSRPLLTQLESVKSMMRNTPPNGTKGLAFPEVNGDNRFPWPPARTKVTVEALIFVLDCMRVLLLIYANLNTEMI